jgi:hypothetical protein
MKQSRTTASRRTKSRTTTSRGTKREIHEDAAVQTPGAPQRDAASAGDQRGATSDAPRSLQTGAGQQHWNEVLRLLVQIRADCAAAAERLGYASAKDDGLAAVEYIGNKILEAVRGERRQQKTTITNKQSTTTRAPDVAWPSVSEARPKSDQQRQPVQPAGLSERSKLIGELKQMLRDGKTKAGAAIDHSLAHEIAKHITTLNDELTQPETPQSIKRVRDSVARFFGKNSGDRKSAAKPAAVAMAPKPQPAKSPSRANKTVTGRSVTKPSAPKPSVTKAAKRSKRRSR